jgi:ankyrin repeat protein
VGALDTVYKQTELVPNQQGSFLLEEAIEFEGLGKIQLAKEKYIHAIEIFRLVLTNRPHDMTARDGVIKCWKKLASLYVGIHLYKLPNDLDYSPVDLPSRSIGFSLIKTILIDAFVEKDWKKQCEGKYGGPKPFNASWKTFYFDNEAEYDAIKKIQDKLIWAVKKGHHRLIKYLFQNKDKSLDINKSVMIDQQETLLELAVKFDYIRVVQLLMDYGIKVNSKGRLKWTPLHWAVQRGNLVMVQLLVEQGARINIKEKNGLIPLHIAALNGYNEIIEYLIEKKAKINVFSEHYKLSPLQLAVYNGHTHCVRQLMNHKADAQRTDNYKRTLLHWAAANGKGEMAELLLKETSVNSIDDMGRTPLHWAAQGGHLDIIKMLLSSKATLSGKDKFEDTPLKIAAFSGYEREVLLLFEYGIRA